MSMLTRSGPTPLSTRNSLFRIASGAGSPFSRELAWSRACRRVPQGMTGEWHGPANQELARFVAQTRCGDIPEAVRAHARLVLLDTLGVILAGSERPEVAALRERL